MRSPALPHGLSLLDGACDIDQLMKLTVEQKMPAVAMTDHGNLFGAVKLYNAAKDAGGLASQKCSRGRPWLRIQLNSLRFCA